MCIIIYILKNEHNFHNCMISSLTVITITLLEEIVLIFAHLKRFYFATTTISIYPM